MDTNDYGNGVKDLFVGDLKKLVFHRDKSKCVTIPWIVDKDYGCLFSCPHIGESMCMSVSDRKAVVEAMCNGLGDGETKRMIVLMHGIPQDKTWNFYTVDGLRTLMSLKGMSRKRDREKFAIWFDKVMSDEVHNLTGRGGVIRSYVQNTKKIVWRDGSRHIIDLTELDVTENSMLSKNSETPCIDPTVVSSPEEHSVCTGKGSLKVFDNDLFRVRVVMRDGAPWFVAKDVASCIEYKDVSTMCKLCRDKDKFVASARDFDSADLAESGNSRITLVSESGLYRILAKCNLPKCEPFEGWVFDEVLPSIRKTGKYELKSPAQQKFALPDFTNPAEAARAWATEYEDKITAQRALSDEQAAHKETRLALTAETERNESLERQNTHMAKVENTALATAARLAGDNKRLSHDIYLNEMYVTQAMSDGTNYHAERNRMFRSVYEFVTQSTTSLRVFKAEVLRNPLMRNRLLTKIDNEMINVFAWYISRACSNGISESFVKDVFKVVRKAWDRQEVPDMGKRTPEDTQVVLNAIYEYAQAQKDAVATSNFKDRWAPPRYSLVIWSTWFQTYFKNFDNSRELHEFINDSTLNVLREIAERGLQCTPNFIMDECAKNFGFFIHS